MAAIAIDRIELRDGLMVSAFISHADFHDTDPTFLPTLPVLSSGSIGSKNRFEFR